MFNKALIIGILLVGASFSVSANEVQKWEYKCLVMNEGLADLYSNQCKKYNDCDYATSDNGVAWKFNQLGDEGWELTTTAYETSDGRRMVCFKRPKKS